MQIVWSEQAADDFSDAITFVAADNLKAAENLAAKILVKVKMLTKTPNIGRPGRVAGTRELVIDGTPYLIPYRIKKGVLQIIRVYHSSRTWPPNSP